MEEINLNVTGMTCQGCVNSVTNALRRVTGVAHVEVSLAQARANVQYDAARTDAAALKAAVETAGFDVS